MINFEDDVAIPQTTVLSDLAKLVEEQRSCEKDVIDLELNLKAAKQRLRKVKETEIPELMQEIGMETFTLSTGQTVTQAGWSQC